jgi:hypothetical protein
MGKVTILRTGEIPYYWYGVCKYCKSVIAYKRNENDFPQIEELKIRCPKCDTICLMYREDTTIGKNIKNMVPLSERENSL